ncbi:hypothetical protein GWK26_08725 [haloarchaeon 3A1-DGR]|nr:hypothetical protein GWK26_08725 [haloarchaeon 3A1-DGR]
MRRHRAPIRDIRAEYDTSADRLTAYHEHRLNALDGDELDLDTTDDGQRRPTVVVHFAPVDAFEPDGFQRTLAEMDDAGVDFYETGSRTRSVATPSAGAFTLSRPPNDRTRDGAEYLKLDEHGLMEIVSQRLTHDSSRGTQFSADTFASLVEGNLAVLVGLLAADSPTTGVVATATFLEFDDVGKTSEYGSLTFEDAARVDTPTVRFDPPGEDHDGEYTAHIDVVDALVRPLWQSSGRFDHPEIDHVESLTIPEYSLV